MKPIRRYWLTNTIAAILLPLILSVLAVLAGRDSFEALGADWEFFNGFLAIPFVSALVLFGSLRRFAPLGRAEARIEVALTQLSPREFLIPKLTLILGIAPGFYLGLALSFLIAAIPTLIAASTEKVGKIIVLALLVGVPVALAAEGFFRGLRLSITGLSGNALYLSMLPELILVCGYPLLMLAATQLILVPYARANPLSGAGLLMVKTVGGPANALLLVLLPLLARRHWRKCLREYFIFD